MDDETRERVGRKVAIWIVANVLILVVTPILHYIYLDRLLDYEYATGIRTSTSGDTIIIPVVGGFIFLIGVLFVVNLFGISYMYFRHHRSDGTKNELRKRLTNVFAG